MSNCTIILAQADGHDVKQLNNCIRKEKIANLEGLLKKVKLLNDESLIELYAQILMCEEKFSKDSNFVLSTSLIMLLKPSSDKYLESILGLYFLLN
ncbi:MAG: hypothetical protein ACJAS3_003428 [Roseivirga sp.]|jgi:hypothetical protein